MYSFLSQLRHSSSFQRVIFIVLPLMHITGFLGLQNSFTQPLFKALVPFHLLTSLAVLLLFHTDWNRPAVFFCLIAYFVGFIIEALGVYTGMIFGQYHYGATLGPKLLDVPLVIGANWLTLIYSAGIIANQWHRSHWIKALLAAGIEYDSQTSKGASPPAAMSDSRALIYTYHRFSRALFVARRKLS